MSSVAFFLLSNDRSIRLHPTSGAVTGDGRRGAFAQWRLEEVSGRGGRGQSVYQVTNVAKGLRLGVTSDGGGVAVPLADADDVQVKVNELGADRRGGRAVSLSDPVNGATLRVGGEQVFRLIVADSTESSSEVVYPAGVPSPAAVGDDAAVAAAGSALVDAVDEVTVTAEPDVVISRLGGSGLFERAAREAAATQTSRVSDSVTSGAAPIAEEGERVEDGDAGVGRSAAGDGDAGAGGGGTGKSEAIGGAASLNCPGGHVLVVSAVPRWGFACDGCRRRLRPGTPIAACRPCNFDLCDECCAASGGFPSTPASAPALERSATGADRRARFAEAVRGELGGRGAGGRGGMGFWLGHRPGHHGAFPSDVLGRRVGPHFHPFHPLMSHCGGASASHSSAASAPSQTASPSAEPAASVGPSAASAAATQDPHAHLIAHRLHHPSPFRFGPMSQRLMAWRELRRRGASGAGGADSGGSSSSSNVCESGAERVSGQTRADDEAAVTGRDEAGDRVEGTAAGASSSEGVDAGQGKEGARQGCGRFGRGPLPAGSFGLSNPLGPFGGPFRGFSPFGRFGGCIPIGGACGRIPRPHGPHGPTGRPDGREGSYGPHGWHGAFGGMGSWKRGTGEEWSGKWWKRVGEAGGRSSGSDSGSGIGSEDEGAMKAAALWAAVEERKRARLERRVAALAAYAAGEGKMSESEREQCEVALRAAHERSLERMRARIIEEKESRGRRVGGIGGFGPIGWMGGRCGRFGMEGAARFGARLGPETPFHHRPFVASPFLHPFHFFHHVRRSPAVPSRDPNDAQTGVPRSEEEEKKDADAAKAVGGDSATAAGSIADETVEPEVETAEGTKEDEAVSVETRVGKVSVKVPGGAAGRVVVTENVDGSVTIAIRQ